MESMVQYDLEYQNACEKGWTEQFTGMTDPYLGFVKTMEQVDRLIESFEEHTQSHFVKVRGFGKGNHYNMDYDLTKRDAFKNRLIKWKGQDCESDLPFDGMPFISLGTCDMVCEYGSRYGAQCNRSPQNGLLGKGSIGARHYERREKLRQKYTKKTGCSAWIRIHRILKFLNYEIEEDKGPMRRKCSKMLREALDQGGEVVTEMRFVIRLPISHDIHPPPRIIRRRKPTKAIKSPENLEKSGPDGRGSYLERGRKLLSMALSNGVVEAEDKDVIRINLVDDNCYGQSSKSQLRQESQDEVLYSFTPPSSFETLLGLTKDITNYIYICDSLEEELTSKVAFHLKTALGLLQARSLNKGPWIRKVRNKYNHISGDDCFS